MLVAFNLVSVQSHLYPVGTAMRIQNTLSSVLIRKMSTTTSAIVTSSSHAEITRAVNAIYTLESKPAFALAVSGGGMQAIPSFLGVPGASACVMDVTVPYSRAATEKYLVEISDHTDHSLNCTRATALKLAKAAYLKTCNLLLRGEGKTAPVAADAICRKSYIFGVSCTAALVSSVPKKGNHRAHVGIYSNSPQGGQVTIYSITLTKGLRDRAAEDELCSRLILDAVSKHVGLPLLSNSLLLTPATAEKQLEVVEVDDFPTNDALENVTARASKHALYFSRRGTDAGDAAFICMENATLPAGTLIYPGSFNPLHDGHLALVRSQLDLLEQQYCASSRRDGDPSPAFKPPLVVFEIGAVNADKPPLPRDEITKRLEQFHAHSNPLFAKWDLRNFAVSVTSEPLFLGKASIFPGCDFLIGADTMVRLINSKYYADRVSTGTGTGAAGGAVAARDSEARRLANMVCALSTIAANRCRFVVGGRAKDVTVGEKVESVFETCDAILQSDYGLIAGGIPEANSSSRVIDVLPQTVVDLFVNLSEEQFRLDLSSTELRNRGLTLDAKIALKTSSCHSV